MLFWHTVHRHNKYVPLISTYYKLCESMFKIVTKNSYRLYMYYTFN